MPPDDPALNLSGETLYLIDASGFVFRAYHAIREPLSTSQGVPTKAVLGFTNMLLKLRREEKPARIAVVFDAERKSFRHTIDPQYKANRKVMPPDLAPQWPYVVRVTQVLGLPLLRVEGVEADDVIATLVAQARSRGIPVVIVSSDKDLMQLVGADVSMFDTMSNKRYGPAEVKEKWGVLPDRLADLLALVGDSSDNVQGIPGVGPKTAAGLLEEFGALDSVLNAGERIGRPKLRDAVAEHADAARRARLLVALRHDVELPLEFDTLRPGDIDRSAALALFRELEFGRIVAELSEQVATPATATQYRTILDEAALGEVIAAIRAAGSLAIDTETTSLEAARADLVGISLAWAEGQACYIPLAHMYLGAPRQLTTKVVLDALRPLFEDVSLPKYGHDHKFDLVVFGRHGVDLRGVVSDPMMASYLLDPSRPSHGLDALAREHLGHEMSAYTDVVGRGKAQIGFDQVDITRATAYSAEDADLTWRLGRLLADRVDEEKLGGLLRDVEIPLARVLATLERTGIKLDVEHLRRLGQETTKKLEDLQKEIHELAGYPVNINSPVQLRELLFEKLELPILRRTKSGPSTDADVLEGLAGQHAIPSKILEWRGLAKMKNTYIDALPLAVHPKTGRLHTSYNQAVAATGRLSASEPNVQNIPIRSELGRAVRRAFVADDGCVLLSCDYSQIELRVLAHLSQDPVLIDTFERNQDVHARTAAEIFGVDVELVSAEMRRVAKSVVYGLSYGQTDFGLAQALGISKSNAHTYIETFFRRYATLASYLESSVERVRAGEPSRTILGRRRFVPDIHAANRMQRGHAERIAKNTPIQGTAADILKVAMIRVQGLLEAELPQTKMLLTVHDELVFETPASSVASNIDRVAEPIRRVMESVIELRVPLRVDIGSGPTWADAHS